jgi:hypothetical protein
MGRKSSSLDNACRQAFDAAGNGGIETRGRMARTGQNVVEIAV